MQEKGDANLNSSLEISDALEQAKINVAVILEPDGSVVGILGLRSDGIQKTIRLVGSQKPGNGIILENI